MRSRIIILLLLSMSFAGCTVLKGTDKSNHAAVCKELKHQMIWSGTGGAPLLWDGATGNQMQATQQRAENETLMRSYREQGCEQDDNGST